MCCALCVLANIRVSKAAAIKKWAGCNVLTAEMKLYYTIFGNSLGAVEKFLGTQAFREKYVEKETKFARQEITAELEVWVCQVDFAAASVKLVSCTEEKIRQKRCRPESFIIYLFCFPASGIRHRHPATSFRHRQPVRDPATGIRHPASGTRRHPATGIRHPAPPAPASGPGTGIRYRHPAPASMLPPAHRHPAPGS